jgi:hypothetical protein
MKLEIPKTIQVICPGTNGWNVWRVLRARVRRDGLIEVLASPIAITLEEEVLEYYIIGRV